MLSIDQVGFGELASRQIMKQLLSVIEILHEREIIHHNLNLDAVKLEFKSLSEEIETSSSGNTRMLAAQDIM